MNVSQAETAGFRARLQSSGFYTRWKATFGPAAWDLLEQYAGKLA
jgi:TRAP-type transport system periplasmic protein